MKPERDTELIDLAPEMADEAATLIGEAMNADEKAWARATIERHFAMRAKGLDDGRRYFALPANGAVVGITGLHHYEWGPDENVWLGWFAVSPKLQGRGFGTHLLTETEQAARALGYRKLFIETYDTPTFARAIRFYQRAGFRKAGTIETYLPDGSAMLVLLKEL
ncbi:MAG TPA: GNAT family N-acetyltransferase [Geobacteraceae bacterium]|nr:GNAT family N-acetyltransferase [Geobacteraceae bacterium]